ncbi:S41 family peptidase [Euzebya pacifica]|uniref:S41 family peptidase n=1 Tax=Euzebya pacifica TaxID=1608957 RepID=UPI0030F97268
MVAPADYLRHPAVHGDTLLVVADDDIWIADLGGGRAHRVTDGRTAASHPLPSPDGTWLAFTSREESHPEVYRMPLEGGPHDRWTHLGASVSVPRAWRAEDRLVLATNARLPFVRDSQLMEVGGDGAPEPRPLGWGTAHEVAFGDDGRVLLGRNTTNQGRWKRYRGGTAGHLWLDGDGSGTFERLLPDLSGDISSPMLIGDRVWFVSDHDGVGNIHSCDLDGGDLRRHTDHHDFYARFAHTDGTTIVYTAGGDVWRLDPFADAGPERVDLRLGSPRTERSRRFVDPSRWLQSYAVHPKGTHVAMRVRGRPFSMPLYDGPVVQHGARDGVNHRLVDWLPDGERLVLLADTDGEERLEVHEPDGTVTRFDDVEVGVPLDLVVSPLDDLVALVDQGGRLRVVDLSDGSVTEVASSVYGVDHPRWSPDGRWLAWSHRESNWYTASIRIWHREDGTEAVVAEGRHANRAPAWDPSGKFLYWIASTRLLPVPDGVRFDHGFPMPDLVVAAVLTEDGRAPMDHDPHAPGQRPGGKKRPKPPPLPSPARGSDEEEPTPVPPVDPDDPSAPDGPSDPDDAGPGDGDPDAVGSEESGADDAGTGDQDPADPLGLKTDDKKTPPPMRLDVEGLSERVVTLPFPTGRYRAVTGLRGKVMAMGMPLRPQPLVPRPPNDRPPMAQLEVLDLMTGKHEVQIPSVSSYAVSEDRSTLVYSVKRRLRAVRAGVKPPEGPGSDGPPRVSGWLQLGRLSVEVSPPAEWRQILAEAWRLQRELFWHAEMSGVDWDAVRDRYLSLVDRIATRAELSDLIWEMLGELGTGHAYERGGDHPSAPQAPLGHLGADVEFGEEGWTVGRVLVGDPTDRSRRMPLRAPGVRVSEGARLLAVDGVPVDESTSPASLLVNRAGKEVSLRVADPDERTVRVRPLSAETPLRYADWVAGNRARVAERSDGRIGYVHIPDMGAGGYAEFTDQYLATMHCEALVVDVRFNGGGNVSSLILETLSGRRIGYQLRRTGALEPYPHHAPAGPLVAVTNERCGSDGDIFTHAWKRLELGPVVGTRTWGGVIGIQPRNPSVDGTVTTQPGFAFWFDDVGFGVENYGTDPTHPVEIAPHDAAAGLDPQLDTAIDLALEALEDQGPPELPDVGTAPMLTRPDLPPR